MNETNVFGDQEASANLAVRDIEKARKFYEETLGLQPVHAEGEEFVVYRSGTSTISIYESEYAGTNKATAVSWAVDDVDEVVRDLSEKGVKFEHYEMPGMELEGDVHVGGEMRLAWFKDPDGNIIGIFNK